MTTHEIVASFGYGKRLSLNYLRSTRHNMVSLIPKDTSFFQMFEAMSDNLVTGARTLVDLFANYRDVERTIDTVQKIERQGDELTHNVLTKLNQTFITPFDREDIHQLASSLDDVLDFVNASGARLVMYRISN
ncbi:MAG TPA: DUF47 family protein, partial [Terriglobales bacterium]